MNRYRFRGMPLETGLRLRKGRELAKRGNDQEALTFFRQAATIAPESSVAFREIAECLSRLGRFDEAERYYRKCRTGRQDEAESRKDGDITTVYHRGGPAAGARTA